MTSPAGATGLTARLPAAVQGKRGRLLIGTGAVVVAIAVGAGILLGTRKAEPDPSLTGVQAPIPTFAPAPLPVPVPAVVPDLITSETLTVPPTPTPAVQPAPKRAAGHDDHAAPHQGRRPTAGTETPAPATADRRPRSRRNPRRRTPPRRRSRRSAIAEPPLGLSERRT